MEANKILNADVLDIIFDGRNKTYGAYELRRTYNKRLWAALITMASVCLFVVVGGLIAKNVSKKAGPVIVKDIQLEEIKTDKPPEVPPPPPPKMPEPPKIEMAKFTPPKIVKDKEVKPDEKPPETK
ncbi:MAG TPA: energy transducer TonB, partial [Chitinophagaceae bacterium]|nr:energy transducer TonB [Chitinophagaceae bacterium]